MTHLAPPSRSSSSIARTSATLAWVLACLPAFGQQITTTLLHNLDQAQVCGATGGPDAAARFRTGSLPLNIEAIQLTWYNAGANPGRNRLGIYTHDAAANRPATTQVGGWKETNADTQTGTMTYNSPTPIALQPNTDYWLVVDITDGAQPNCTTSSSFTAGGEASGPAQNRSAAIGTAGGTTWPTLHTALTLVYALDGTTGAAPPAGVPDMATGTAGMPAGGTVGTPFTGQFECANIGQRDTYGGTFCSAIGLPPGLSVDACTISPASTPWQHHDQVPAGQRVTCVVAGTPSAAGTYPVTLRTGTEVDANSGNDEARMDITIAAAGPLAPPGPGGVQAVPSLSAWGTALLGGLLVAAGRGMHRRRVTRSR